MMDIRQYADEKSGYLVDLTKKIALIPALSRHEEQRAEWCKKWLEEKGAAGAYVDDAKNLIYPLHPSKSGRWIVFTAHMDTVFGPDVKLEIKSEGDRLYCPGIGDNTANLAVMLCGIEYLLKYGYNDMEDGILFAGCACEECGGAGTKYLVDALGAENIRFFYSFDATYHSVYTGVVNRIILSITVKTPGGHPLGAYGKPNAIEEISAFLCNISTEYRRFIAGLTKGRSAFNIDTIEGGIGNSIADYAAVQVQLRSTHKEYYEYMLHYLKEYISSHSKDNISFSLSASDEVPLLSTVDEALMNRFGEEHLEIIRKLGINARASQATTDCRYPMHKGIPSLCMGLCDAGGAHTTNEYLLPDSLKPGMRVLLEIFRKNDII